MPVKTEPVVLEALALPPPLFGSVVARTGEIEKSVAVSTIAVIIVAKTLDALFFIITYILAQKTEKAKLSRLCL